MTRKAVIFDLDCTLHDRETSLFLFLKSQYERLLANKSTVSFLAFYKEFLNLEQLGRKWKDVVYEELLVKYPEINLTRRELLDDYIYSFKDHCVAFEGTYDMLTKLKSQDYMLGMITNGKTDFQKATIHALGIGPLFDDIIISDEIGFKKPDKRIFEASLHNLKVNVEHAIYIGDHPVDDIRAASNLGLMTVWKVNNYWGKAETSYYFDSMSDLPELIDSIFNQVALKE